MKFNFLIVPGVALHLHRQPRHGHAQISEGKGEGADLEVLVDEHTALILSFPALRRCPQPQRIRAVQELRWVECPQYSGDGARACYYPAISLWQRLVRAQ